jgi:hypothetical protein
MPLPDLAEYGFCVASLDLIGRAATEDIAETDRVACLSEYGVNVLQQRMTFHLTRAAIPTSQFHEAFAHTVIEADLLEDWTDALIDAGRTFSDAVSLFEDFIRAGDPSLQDQLLDPERRATVRKACIQGARTIAATG